MTDFLKKEMNYFLVVYFLTLLLVVFVVWSKCNSLVVRRSKSVKKVKRYIGLLHSWSQFSMISLFQSFKIEYLQEKIKNVKYQRSAKDTILKNTDKAWKNCLKV